MFPPDITCICQWLWVVVKGDGGAMREQEEKEEEVIIHYNISNPIKNHLQPTRSINNNNINFLLFLPLLNLVWQFLKV